MKHEEGAAGVNGHNRIEIRDGGGCDGGVVGVDDAGGVDDDVRGRVEGLLGLLEDGADGGRIGYVSAEGNCSGVGGWGGGIDFGGEAVGFGGAGGEAEGHGSPEGGEMDGDGAADATAGAGHDGYAAVQGERHVWFVENLFIKRRAMVV